MARCNVLSINVPSYFKQKFSYNNNNNNIHICIAPYGRNFRVFVKIITGAQMGQWTRFVYNRPSKSPCASSNGS